MVIRSPTKEHEGQEYTYERQLRLPCDRSMCGVASNRKGKQASRNDRHLEGLRNLTPRRACSAFMDKRANKGCIYSNKDAYFMQIPVQQQVFSSLGMISNANFHEQRRKHILRQLHIIQRQMTISYIDHILVLIFNAHNSL